MASGYKKILFRLNSSSVEDMTVDNLLSQFATSQQRNRFIIKSILHYANGAGKDYVINGSCGKSTANDNNVDYLVTEASDISEEKINDTDQPLEQPIDDKTSAEISNESSNLSDSNEMLKLIINKLAIMEERITKIESLPEETTKLIDKEEILKRINNDAAEAVDQVTVDINQITNETENNLIEEHLNISEERVPESKFDSDIKYAAEGHPENDADPDRPDELTSYRTEDRRISEAGEDYEDTEDVTEDDSTSEKIDGISENESETNDWAEKEKNEFDLMDQNYISGAVESLFNLYNESK